jgi:hypothetical protein
VNAYLHSNHLARWTELHGDDEGDFEGGFHLVQNDGATTHVFGDSNAINTVADGIYHLGFATRGNRLLNEDGNRNATLEDVAFWLSEFLADDLVAGALAGDRVDLAVTPSTGKGLDSLVSIITTDHGLIQRISTSEIVEGARAADAMNVLIIEAIIATGVANDGIFHAADIRDVNAYLRANHSDQWVVLHGDDEEDGSETGFHLVQGDGAETHLFGDSNAVNTVADGIYHLGFGTSGNRLLNEDGNRRLVKRTARRRSTPRLARQLGGGLDRDPVDRHGTGLLDHDDHNRSGVDSSRSHLRDR